MLDEFVGNEAAKERIKISLKATKEMNRPFPNMLFSGKAGVGKTKMFKCIAEELNAINYCINASTVDRTEDIVNIVHKSIEEFQIYGGVKRIIIGIDEAHALKNKVADFLLTAISENELCIKTYRGIEKAKIYNKDTGTNDFLSWIFITNRAAELPIALRSRLLQVGFIDYSRKEKAEICKRILKKSHIDIYNNAALELAKRSWSARDVIQNTEMLISYKCLNMTKKINKEYVKDFFKVYDIDENGLGATEKKYYNILKEAARPMSIQSVSSILGIGVRDALMIEEKLIVTGLIEIIPKGRVCTDTMEDLFAI